MAINVSDLPPKYQAQAMKKYMEQQKQRRAQRGLPRRKRRQQEQRQAQQRALVPQLEPAEQSLATAAELEEQPYVGRGDARAGRGIPPPC